MQRWPAAVACLLQIPLVMFLMTHAYFLFYHALANMVLRRVRCSGEAATSMAVFGLQLGAINTQALWPCYAICTCNCIVLILSGHIIVVAGLQPEGRSPACGSGVQVAGLQLGAGEEQDFVCFAMPSQLSCNCIMYNFRATLCCRTV
jgi:hypothetical protein